ncbi:putative tetratricopeptide-like helical domain superfamily, ubiquitin specific protease [Helianthus debilis subsp. tardiflorus]
MGRKRRNADSRSKSAATPAGNHPPPALSAANNGGDDVEVSSLTTELDLGLNSSIQPQFNLENEVSVSIESDGYSAVKIECEKALNALRRGNYKKAVRLMKELCAKHENGNSACLALVYRVQGTVCVKVAGIMDDLNAKQRYAKSAVESARKAVVLSPNSVEFAHFYANLLCDTATDAKEFEESVRECERALMIKNPIDPGKESLQDESQQKIGSADARIEHVQNELRVLHQKANVGSISSWMRSLNNGEEHVRFFPIRTRVADDPMDVRTVQGRRSNDIKKASKTDEERKKEIEVKVAAARLLQQKLESSQSQTEGDKGPESSTAPSQRTGERRKSGKVKKNASTIERKDCVLSYWKSMGTDLKKDLCKIRITDIKNHFKSPKDGLGYEVLTEALSFGASNNSWRYWMCCRCSEKFADPELHKQHIAQEHMYGLSPKLQALLPLDVDSEWTEMLLTHPWRALDADAAVRMIESQSNSSVSNADWFSDGYGYEDAWDSPSVQKKYGDGPDGCNGIGKDPDCVPMECDQSEGRKGCFNPDSWPLSDDVERTKLLEKIKTLFQLLIKHKCLAASHLTKVIQFAVEELHPQLLNCGAEQSPFCICLLGATELRKVLMFLQELSHSCGVGRYLEKGNVLEESNNVTQANEMAEKLVFDQDDSSLLLNANTCHDGDSFLSWIFSGPTSQEELTLWTRTRDENVHKGTEILENIGKEFSHLQSLCDRKLEHMSYEEALQLIEDLCLEEDKRREHDTEFVHQSYESILRKRREEITQHDNDVTHVNRFEIEVLTNVLKEADSMNVKQFGFEDTYGGVNVNNSHVFDLESGEDDWRVNDYLQQLDSCVKNGIQKQKEQLSIELSKIDARIMRTLSEIQQLEAKLGPLCAHDFGLIVMPLVKSYLRAHLENLAEKDATEKSDAAREAFLAELALDSKKGTGDIPKHVNEKVKDKRKNKEYRKTKDSKPTGAGELHVLPNEKAEKAFLDPQVIDEQVNESVVEVSVAFDEQEDEVRRRKIELEDEERKLEATLEYQRRIEDETKQRHLAEQHKNSSRMTPVSMEPVNQSNGLLTLPEDGLSERTGTMEDGALLYESRAGRRGRRQKNITKPSDGRQQPLSSGKETTEFGRNSYSDLLQDSSSGDNERRILMLQAEDNDEKRFQADLSKAVRQSLDAFHSHKQSSSISGSIIPEETFIEEQDSCVTSIKVSPDNVNESDVYGTGLKNEVGEYNCFLNVIIQSLWHLRRFREEFLSASTSFHLHVGDPCVTCALYDIFSALSFASDTKVQAVAPTSLRIALSKLYPDSNFFQEAQMNDASEVLGVIFDCLHKSFTSVTGISGTELVENNIMGSWECINKACTAHSIFGLDIYERMNCYSCGLETRRLKYTSFFHQINANALRTMKVMCPEGSFDELLNLVEMNHQLACDPEDGGCGKLNYIHHILSTPPHVFTTVLGWQNTCESVDDIKATLAALSTEIDLSVLYRGLDPNNKRRLVSVVCYYGQHYHCFAYTHVHQRWVMYDDKTVKVIGRWEDVVSVCEKGHLQPQVLFYEAVN